MNSQLLSTTPLKGHPVLRQSIPTLLVISSVYQSAAAITVQVVGTDGGANPVVTHAAGNASSFNLSLQLMNETQAPEGISLWQLELDLIGDSAASGQLQFVDASDPPVPLLTSVGAPVVLPTTPLPASHILVQDADIPPFPELPGKTIAADESRSILNLQLSGTTETSGKFFLTIGNFDSAIPLAGSVWLDDSFPPSSRAFANAVSPPGDIVLAEIIWGQATENADFNQNGQVDGSDFLRWQTGFGQGSTLGEGDANADGIVNADDLGVWETQFGEFANVASLVVVPEPGGSTLYFLTVLSYISSARIRCSPKAARFSGD